jgi:hypothetical protein
MTYCGHIKNGQITLDEPVQLPEGAQVNVNIIDEGEGHRRQMLKMPIEQRRELLMRQSERLAPHYECDAEMEDWQGGDILE